MSLSGNNPLRTESIDTSVVAQFLKLQPKGVPEHLLDGDTIRMEDDFDPNAYFTALKHLSMKPGYVLDFVYDSLRDFVGEEELTFIKEKRLPPFDGCPLLYARTVNGEPLKSAAEHKEWQKNNDLYSFLIVDDSADGFFQLFVFRELAGQFYLWWHSHYHDTMILTAQEEVESLISEVNEGRFGAEFTNEQIAKMRKLEMRPTVEFRNDRVSVTCCRFSKWFGLHRETESFHRDPPHQLINRRYLNGVDYDCGVCF